MTKSQIQPLTIRMNDGTERAFYYRPASSDEALVREVFGSGSYDLRKVDRTKKQHRYESILVFLEEQRRRTGKKPLILDVGANIGAATLHYLSEFDDALVVAIEPEQGNFELLQKNTAGLSVQCIR